jgi:hypothetical protein
MRPALFGGVALAFIAFLASCIPGTTRGAALLCVAATASTGIGVAVAAGISAQHPVRAAVFDGVMLLVPTITALDALRRAKRYAGARMPAQEAG